MVTALQVAGISPSELLEAAYENARQLSAIILKLTNIPLIDGESMTDRAIRIAGHAVTLAETFQLIDELAKSLSPRLVATPVSQGCGQEGIN